MSSDIAVPGAGSASKWNAARIATGRIAGARIARAGIAGARFIRARPAVARLPEALLSATLITATMLGGPSCGPSARRGEPARVAVASIGPLADWARHVAGPAWQVQCLLPPGANPHTYDFRPRDLGRFERASLALRVGAGLDPFMERLVETYHPRETFTLSEGNTLMEDNPHLWLDPVIARRSLGRIAEQLARIEPADSTGFRARAAAYGASMDSLDREYRAAADSFRVRRFVSFHPAWLYLARRYGLEQAGSIETAPGREPGPSDWAHLIELLRASGAHAVFTEPQYARRMPAALAADAGVRLLFVDDLGTTGEPGGESYVRLMRRNLSALREGLR